MKQKRIANIVLVLAFAGFLAAAMVITLGKPKGAGPTMKTALWPKWRSLRPRLSGMEPLLTV